ncbi:MAG: SLATT domain-containing protein [Cyanobacteria bacterium P01_H01_bin.105]
MPEGIREYCENLSRRMWITRGARFNASRRLTKKHHWSLASISILSVYGISIPIIQSLIDFSKCSEVNQVYSAIATVLSVFILVISLLEGGKNFQLRADSLHINAVEISRLCRELEFLLSQNISGESLVEKSKEISDEYEKLISDCPYNHEVRDFDLFKFQNYKDFNVNVFESYFRKNKILLLDFWLYSLPIFVFPVVVFQLYSYCQ